MKYTNRLEIEKPIDEVVRLISDPDLRPQWLRGLVKHELIDGIDGQVGSRSLVVFRQGDSTVECTETVTLRDPENLDDLAPVCVVRFEREISAEGMHSITRDRLVPISGGRTWWSSEEEYRFDGPMGLIAPVMKGAFRKQSLLHMEDFKAFAEHGTDVRSTRD